MQATVFKRKILFQNPQAKVRLDNQTRRTNHQRKSIQLPTYHHQESGLS